MNNGYLVLGIMGSAIALYLIAYLIYWVFTNVRRK